MCQVRCIVITDVFPPIAAVGIHRTVALCKHLTERGWGVTVITARPGADAALDEGLLERVSEDVRVVRTAAPDLLGAVTGIFRRRRRKKSSEQAGIAPQLDATAKPRLSLFRRMVDWLSWWLHIPDGSIGWFVPAVLAGLREARRHRPDVIYSSAPMWTSHLVGLVLSRLLRVPWVADFRDPWCGSQWRKIPYRMHRKIDGLLEQFVIGGTKRITCAWDGIRKHLVLRYPAKAKRITTILNGFDPEQIDPVAPVGLNNEGRCVLLHAGMLYGPRSPIPLLEGLRCFREESPSDAERLLVVFLGLETYNGRPLKELVGEYGLDGLVRIMPPAPHRQALAYLKGADVAVLFGQGGEDSLAPVPAKVYEYIGAGKSVLSIGTGQEAVDIMRRGGCRLWCAADDAESVAKSFAEILSEFGRCSSRQQSDPITRESFTRAEMSRRLERVLREATSVVRKF